MAEKIQVRLDESGNPRADLYGELARCRISELEWLLNAPFGATKKRAASLKRELKARDKAEKAKEKGSFAGARA